MHACIPISLQNFMLIFSVLKCRIKFQKQEKIAPKLKKKKKYNKVKESNVHIRYFFFFFKMAYMLAPSTYFGSVRLYKHIKHWIED